MANKQLSDNEIWDDSALVQSWNEALEEYKKYHSMSARGERVDDVLDAAEKEEEAQYVLTKSVYDTTVLRKMNRSTTNLKNEIVDTSTGLPPWESVEAEKATTSEVAKDSRIESVDAQPIYNTNQVPPPGVSQVLLDSAPVQDESLKALMTSWYFAGYYTGLYEGQRKAQTAQEHSNH
ncbi:hypothetical protein E4T48_02928 [Aureobasidium sp. EXF-10727]|nr:hypothetical protein E4T48_02928 [Aureobasidium sp. EXF-10727]